MSFDIYGNYLRPGYCEVHPEMPETYPCSECYYDYYPPEQEQPYPDEMDAAYNRYYEKLQWIDAVRYRYNGIPASAVHNRIDKWWYKEAPE